MANQKKIKLCLPNTKNMDTELNNKEMKWGTRNTHLKNEEDFHRQESNKLKWNEKQWNRHSDQIDETSWNIKKKQNNKINIITGRTFLGKS